MDAQIAQNGDGDYALGFTVDGAFVPLATVASHRVAHLVERQATLKARTDDPSHEGHEQAVKASEGDWKVATPKAAASAEPSSTEQASPSPTEPTEQGSPSSTGQATPATSTGQEL